MRQGSLVRGQRLPSVRDTARQHGVAIGTAVQAYRWLEDAQLIEADTIVLCAGQEPLRELEAPLRAAGVPVHLIGGALEAGELDAKRAIDQAARLAARL